VLDKIKQALFYAVAFICIVIMVAVILPFAFISVLYEVVCEIRQGKKIRWW
jgi:hypothetical protein